MVSIMILVSVILLKVDAVEKKKLIKTLHVSMLYGGRLFGLFVLYLLGKNDKQVVK